MKVLSCIAMMSLMTSVSMVDGAYGDAALIAAVISLGALTALGVVAEKKGDYNT